MPRPLSPFQRHQARVRQAEAQAATPYGEQLAGSAYDLVRARFAQDKRRLGEVQSHERRAEIKAKLLPDYLDWIETAINKGNGAQDNVLAGLMVWAFDAGAYALGLRIASYVISHNLAMSDEYKRSPAAVVIDDLANAYLQGRWNPLTATCDYDGTITFVPLEFAGDNAVADQAGYLLATAQSITEGKDAPDQARAKLHKAIAYARLGKVQSAEEPDLSAIGAELLASVRDDLQRALQLDSNAGVKKDIERIERALAKLTAPAQQPAAQQPEPAPQQPATAKPTRARQTATPAAAKKPAAASKTASKRAAGKR